LKLSEIMSQQEWAWIVKKCQPANVNPKLIAAIGWHETHWGRLGMGKYGFHMGVSCWVRNDTQFNYDKNRGDVDFITYSKVENGHLYCNLSFKGYQKQVSWAINKFKDVVPYAIGYPHVLFIAENIWKPGNPKAWANSVWWIYSELEVDLPSEMLPSEPEEIPSVEGDVPDSTNIIQRIGYYLQKIAELLQEWRD